MEKLAMQKLTKKLRTPLYLTAFLAFHLRGIGDTIESSAQSWDDRNYWKKAEKLRADYRWAPQTADQIEAHIVAEQWADVTPLLFDLIPHFTGVNIGKMTRDADLWVGAHRALLKRAG